MVYSIKYVLSLLAAAMVAAPAVAAPLEASTAPNDVSIKNIAWGGTGCPAGTSSIRLSNDRQSFTATFRDYQVYQRDNNHITERRKFCQINLLLNVPAGWQFTLLETSFSGYASLHAPKSAVISTSYYFTGESAPGPKVSFYISGPVYENFNLRTSSWVGDNVWSPCGRETMLNIKSDMRLQGDGYGAIRVLRGVGHLGNDYRIGWRRC